MRALVSALLTLALPISAAAAPRLLKDLNPGRVPDNGGYLGFLEPAVQDGVLYFVASDPAHGFEVWRTDGTPAGTFRLTDVCPGPCSSFPNAFAFSRGQLYFQAEDGSSGRELWRSDGTPGGERRVRDLCPGPCSYGIEYRNALAPAGDVLYFVVTDSQVATLWRTTGSRRSTVPVAPLCDVVGTNSCSASWPTPVGDRVLLRVTSSGGETALWASDGTAAGTAPLPGPGGGPLQVDRLILNGDFAFLHTPDGLWRTDGTAAGTFRLIAWSELPSPPGGHSGEWSTLWRGSYYASFHNGTLLVSDGTVAGTRLVPGFPDLPFVNTVGTTPDWIIVVSDGTLWRTRGEPGTTEVLFAPEDTPDVFNLFVPLGDRILFSVYRADQKPEIWVTDGTPAGTRRLEGIEIDTISLAAAGDRAYFVKGDTGTGGFDELWRTDGTEAGTRLVRNFGDLPASSGPLDQAALGGAVIFSADSGETDEDGAPVVPLFRSDGTRAGTRRLSTEASGAHRFTRAGDRLFFGGADLIVHPTHTVLRPDSVWSTDGTAAGTRLTRRPMVAWQPVGALAGGVLFGGAESSPFHFGGPEVEPWLARVGGATQVKDVYRFEVETGHHHICVPGGSDPGPGAAVGGALIFAADDGHYGRELWRSDGTREGTRLIVDINPSLYPQHPAPDCDSRTETPLGSDPRELVSFRGGALFTADDGVHGREVWWTDGTRAGTRLVADLLPGAAGSAPHGLVAWGNRVYFLAAVPGGGEGLWSTDGTAAGTVLVRGLSAAGLPSWGAQLTAAGSRLFFAVYNEGTGTELWTSRGDAASTRLVADLRPGAPGSFPQALTAVGNGRIVFAADDGQTGQEPWISDGTAAGTARLGDINPGRDASGPGPFTLGRGFVLTGAWEPVHGREPWAIPVR